MRAQGFLRREWIQLARDGRAIAPRSLSRAAKTRCPCLLLVSWLLLMSVVAPVTSSAQHISIRVSVKYILGPSNAVPQGVWSNPIHWRRAIDLANAGNARMGRGFRYEYPAFHGNVGGFSQYYDLQSIETTNFEYSIRTSASSLWRADALNVYVVHSNLGTLAEPSCAGWASNPQDPLSSTPPYNTMRGRIVVFCVNMLPEAGPFSVLAHEFGHHQGLIHTWADDRVADTPYDADPAPCEQNTVTNWCSCKFSNSLATAAAQGWSAALLRVMTNNIMSYHCGNDLDFDLTEGQLDRWTDMTRMYLATECTGVARFVQAGSAAVQPDGYSRSYFNIPFLGSIGGPFPKVNDGVTAANAAGGDIVVLRPGAYNEQFTINKSVTLRATRGGPATIGKP